MIEIIEISPAPWRLRRVPVVPEGPVEIVDAEGHLVGMLASREDGRRVCAAIRACEFISTSDLEDAGRQPLEFALRASLGGRRTEELPHQKEEPIES